LREIRRLYVQDGRIVENAQVQVQGIDRGNSITDAYYTQKKTFGDVNAFAALGGMKSMGESLRRGMVLVFSVWHDAGSAMKWFDGTFPVNADPTKEPGTGRGPCKADEKRPRISSFMPRGLDSNFPTSKLVKLARRLLEKNEASAPLLTGFCLPSALSSVHHPDR